MDRVVIRTKKVEERVHNFSCDICGKHICSSTECDDGYVDAPLAYKVRVEMSTSPFYMYYNKLLCDECKCAIKDDIVTILTSKGFTTKDPDD